MLRQMKVQGTVLRSQGRKRILTELLIKCMVIMQAKCRM